MYVYILRKYWSICTFTLAKQHGFGDRQYRFHLSFLDCLFQSRKKSWETTLPLSLRWRFCSDDMQSAFAVFVYRLSCGRRSRVNPQWGAHREWRRLILASVGSEVAGTSGMPQNLHYFTCTASVWSAVDSCLPADGLASCLNHQTGDSETVIQLTSSSVIQ